MRPSLVLIPLLIAAPAAADSYCDILVGYAHDAPKNAVHTVTIQDRSGPQLLADPALPGAHCLVTPYNPTGVKDHPVEQSVYCYASANEDGYQKLFDDINTRVASCIEQPARGDAFNQRVEYITNFGVMRVSVDQMTNDWAISVTVMPAD